MEIKNINEKEFENARKNGNVLVDFYATWCGPCKMLSAELEEIKDQIQIIKIDIDENMNLCKKYGIMNVPTLIYFKNKDQYEKQIGFMPKKNILNWIEEQK